MPAPVPSVPEVDWSLRGFVAFECAGEPVGWLRRAFAGQLRGCCDCLAVHDDRVVLGPALRTPAERSAALAHCVAALARAGLIAGWRGETCTIRSGRDRRPLFDVERAACRRFGLATRGANLNGYVGRGDGLQVWVARRSLGKPVDPGLLDTLVGGGVASGYTEWETLLKESGEEAGLPRELASRAVPAGRVRSEHEVPEGLHREVVLAYDLALPAGFVPTSVDGEVTEFRLLPARAVSECLAGGAFAVEAGLVVRDFLRRHLPAAAG